jgi:hypothetical protein
LCREFDDRRVLRYVFACGESAHCCRARRSELFHLDPHVGDSPLDVLEAIHLSPKHSSLATERHGFVYG